MMIGIEVQPQQVVCHTCDNPPCIWPGHLFVGDQADNEQDKVAKRRHRYSARDECKNGHEFTPENTHLRADGRGRTCRACSREFNAAKRNGTLDQLRAERAERPRW